MLLAIALGGFSQRKGWEINERRRRWHVRNPQERPQRRIRTQPRTHLPPFQGQISLPRRATSRARVAERRAYQTTIKGSLVAPRPGHCLSSSNPNGYRTLNQHPFVRNRLGGLSSWRQVVGQDPCLPPLLIKRIFELSHF